MDVMDLVERCILLGWIALPVAGQVFHAPDSSPGDRYSTFEVPSKVDAPFRASVVSSWKYRSTTNWNRHTLFNTRTVARDGAGRVYQERRMYSPNGETKRTTVTELDFYDPSKGTVLVFDPRNGRCTAQHYVVDRGDDRPLPLTQHEAGASVQRKSLGEAVVQSLRVLGSREIVTAQGQTAPSTTKEFWYSPQLAVNMKFTRTDWNRDGQTFALKDVVLGEPDTKLFTPPAACATQR